ncbi:hypothetical protein H6G06_25595 [Anabaena sphaerica FACHB-251]|uniref:Uncharacterized protein n=1 Tax=Anabaena sphaerica FACHB-251 TaxID=2692883 RepID=A0A927A3I9_9NOST|nr:hypothetical protein [Anabaena sphaerica]MBD2296764.1 hypothetical protein [Anabaena sphaerica FACHB-251]
MTINRSALISVLGAGLLMFGVPAVTLTQSASAQQKTKQATFANLIAALNNISAEIQNLSVLNNLTVSQVRVVNVENLLNDNNVKVFNDALNKNNVQILTLRNVLNNNEVIQNVLNNNNVDIGQVVAIDVLSGGDVIVFYK